MTKNFNWDDVVDEKCACGHLRSKHNDLIPVIAVGKGDCKECKCKRFTWVSFVMKKGGK